MKAVIAAITLLVGGSVAWYWLANRHLAHTMRRGWSA